MEQGGIYAIEHLESGRLYIGSAKNFEKRWYVHRWDLRKGVHHSAYLQRAWVKYGEAAFAFRPLLICAEPMLEEYEQRCIDGYGTLHNAHGFNVAPVAGSMRGFKHSDESRKKMAAWPRKPMSDAHKAIISAANKGRKLSPEHVAKVMQTKAAKGRVTVSDATREKMRAAKLGGKASPETRALLSAMRKGRKMPEWFGAYITATRTGQKRSAEAIEKTASALRGRKATLAAKEARYKLTQVEANQIRDLYTSGLFIQREIAGWYGIDPSVISCIHTGRYWVLMT